MGRAHLQLDASGPFLCGPATEGPSTTRRQGSDCRYSVHGIPGKVLYYKLSGKNINKDDFNLSYSGLSGKIKIGDDGQAFVPVLPKNVNPSTRSFDRAEIVVTDGSLSEEYTNFAPHGYGRGQI